MGAQVTSAILSARSKVLAQLAEGGRAHLHSKHPDEFEYYLCALEIVDANDNNNVLDYILFPILPDNIRISDTKIQSTTKTSNGTVVLENSSFIPLDMTISGNFGRKIKMVNGKGESFPASISSKKASSGVSDSKKKKIEFPEFSISAKSGYGLNKVLQRMFDKSSETYEGVPVQMFFYNFAFNANYLIQPVNINFSQNRGSMNMIWEYTMQFKAIAPADEIRSDDDYNDTINKYLKEAVFTSGVKKVLGFVGDQAKILSNQLQFQVGEISGLNEGVNKIPQAARAPF